MAKRCSKCGVKLSVYDILEENICNKCYNDSQCQDKKHEVKKSD